MAKNEEIKEAECCEYCNWWGDKDALIGFCSEHQCDTSLTETCDKFHWLDRYKVKQEKGLKS